MSRRLILWIVLILICLLTALSVVGAFVAGIAGVERAQALFTSAPAALLWLALALTLVAGIAAFPTLVRRPGLLLSHLGCVLILGGAFWGSEAGHGLRARLWSDTRVRRAVLEIPEGTREDRVRTVDNTVASLPFALALDRFQIDYYVPGKLQIQTPGGRILSISAKEGEVCDLGRDLGQVRVVRTFEHFRIAMDPNNRTPFEDPNAGPNPAVEVQIIRPLGATQRQFVFERFGMPHQTGDGLGLSYRRMIKDYISRVRVIAHDQVVAQKAIEVNGPLHYGGYSFYQSDYGADQNGKPYTVLTVVCDCGLYGVYAGYVMLGLGVAWQLWGAKPGSKK